LVKLCFYFLDFDGDDMLGVNDIKQVIQCLVGEHNSFNDNDLKYLVQKIFEEVDFDDDGALSFSEFEHVTDMCPDFVKLVKLFYAMVYFNWRNIYLFSKLY